MQPDTRSSSAEHRRLNEAVQGPLRHWTKWGPYVAERAWGTVREDYSADGDAWAFLTHDLARSKAYRWGEDGIAGWCDRYQVLVFALALWNGRDPILKERLFGLVGSESNHGEDVKEYYFYVDGTPTHSYMKYLYKYPQAAYPYTQLIEESRRRSRQEPEYELLDTGVFDEDRYFDVFVEYAKADPEDTCIRIEVCNRGPAAAPIHVLPHLWFRNSWSWKDEPRPQPRISLATDGRGHPCLVADDSEAGPVRGLPFRYNLGARYLYAQPGAQTLFTDNETNGERVHGPGAESRSPFVKDAFHRYVIAGEPCVNPAREGSKASFHYAGVSVPAGGSAVIRLRLTNRRLAEDPIAAVDEIVSLRRAEADEFYATIHPPRASVDERLVQRQAFAGMLWSKQMYLFNVHVWLDGDSPSWPPPESHRHVRNVHWRHLNSMRLFSMPDKWEYPWFAAWDLAFHAVVFAVIDPTFAKEQLWQLLFEQFQHPNGQIPAYEWEFSDLNPPVHAWAVWRVYNMDRLRSGRADRDFLERCFHKLLINFAWWVNKVDREGNNIFEGGFLGLDNITVIDRSDIPGGARLEQSDATGWMGMFCLNLMRIALELAKENKVYESLATKFFEHYVYIGAAMKRMGPNHYQLWDEADGFFYDVLRYPNGAFHKFRLRSLVGVIPLYAIERLEESWIEPFEEFRSNLHWFLENRQDLVQRCVTTVEHDGEKVHVLAIMNPEQMHRLLQRVWDPHEFRSRFGLRSLSRHHAEHPFVFADTAVGYEPGESFESLKGGNSNWRGPIWFPTTFLLIESLRKLEKAYRDTFRVETAAGEVTTLGEMARGFADALIRLFTRDAGGRRAAHGDSGKHQEDPHWRDYVLFYEYYHGDSGRGLGASHQTGWSGLIANLIDEWRR